MQTDVILVAGLVLGALAVPAFLNAFVEGRFPRVALSVTVLAAGMLTWANTTRPSGYKLEEVPSVFMRVFAQVLN